MPLMTKVIRNGEDLKLPWGRFHVAAMTMAAMFERTDPPFNEARPNDDLDYPTEPQPVSGANAFQLVDYGVLAAVFDGGDVTLRENHAFEDAMDGEIFILKSGDVLRVWRR